MRKITPEVLTLLAQDFISPFYLVFLNTAIPHADTTLPFSFSYSGRSYTNLGKLLSVDPPRMSSVVDREAYKISYADPDFEFRTQIEDAILGTTIEVAMGLINTTDSVLAGIQPGQPMPGSHIIPIYEGWVDAPSYAISPEGQVVASLEGTSPMSALGLVKTMFTSKDSIKQINPSDTSFDQIYEGSKGIELLWGKK